MAACFEGGGKKGEEKLDLSKIIGHGGASGDMRNAFSGLFRARRFGMTSMQALPEKADPLFHVPATRANVVGTRRVV